MLTTNEENFGLEFYDSTVTILPGSARIGNTIMKFDGTRASYYSLTDFGSSLNVYQNTLIYLQNLDSATDMTQVRSDTTTSLRALSSPELPSDSSNTYSFNYPLSMLTFFTDGTTIDLIDNKGI